VAADLGVVSRARRLDRAAASQVNERNAFRAVDDDVPTTS
jgi:hypothetical protein